ncbi:MAG: Uma2 family endonuclease [Planctomycetia bacterium]|nr:Uma2 family endonuclease [Planctomycetia bacterium]
MSSLPKKRITPEEYLAIERRAETKSEYYKGEMFAMTGASRAHNLITVNLASELRNRLKGRRCETFASDMRVKVSRSGLYTYPDVVVVCGEPRFEDDRADTLLNPTLIAEVLSPTTESYDRGRKFDHYQSLNSLKEYVLVSQDRFSVDLFRRQPDGDWVVTGIKDASQVVRFTSLNCEVPMSEIYRQVDLPAGSSDLGAVE